jgi:hypothetical protein
MGGKGSRASIKERETFQLEIKNPKENFDGFLLPMWALLALNLSVWQHRPFLIERGTVAYVVGIS